MHHFDWPPGPHMHEVCTACDYNLHRCHFCGDDLTHTEANWTHNPPHLCYTPEHLESLATGVQD